MGTAISALKAQATGTGLLRLALKVDALVTGANGVAYLAAANLLDEPLGVPASFLRPIGAFLVVFGVVVWAVASRGLLSRTAAAAVVAANVLWVLDSIAFVAADWYTPATAGAVWIVLQAIVVGAFAALQVAGLRRG